MNKAIQKEIICMYLIENEHIALIPYTHEDDKDMYRCWQDEQTQKGYNVVFDQSFEEFQKADIKRFKFWVTVIDKHSNARIGVLRLGLDEQCPDLAIWIYPQYRNKGYGVTAFRLALEYIFDSYEYPEIAAGCYIDNDDSLKILKKWDLYRSRRGMRKSETALPGKKLCNFRSRYRERRLFPKRPTFTCE